MLLALLGHYRCSCFRIVNCVYFATIFAILIPNTANSTFSTQKTISARQFSRAGDQMASINSDPQTAVFHPPRITTPQRVIKAAHGLTQMPREIVHQILDDMTVFQVLQLASCLQDSTYIDQCILGHPLYQQLFGSQQVLTAIRDLFIVFYEIRISLNLVHAPVSNPRS